MNFQKLLEEEINKIKDNNKKPKLLLHACCGPCSSYVIEYLSNYFDITIYYYNPNIYPEDEYLRRLNELIKFIKKFNDKITVIEEKYNTKEYYDKIKGLENLGERSKRCYNCYKFRMDKAAIYAKHNNYDYFTTTLSISPYKNAEWLNANEKNLITGTRYMNVEGMLLFENIVADYIKKTGNHVLYRVTPIFKENNLVVSGVQMEAKSVEDNGQGVQFNVYVYNNQPGIEINYLTGESKLK